MRVTCAAEMYTNNKSGSAFENTITVTPIKVEVNMSPSYPTPNSSGGSVAVAATTSSRRTTSAPAQQQAPVVGGTGYSAVCSTSGSGAIAKEKSSKATRNHAARKPPPTIDNFWPNILADVRSIQQVDAKHQALPLARIKKIMKLDENAKMIAAEAPLLFAKACEYFIQELTMRAWIHTEESKRRTLQRSDIAQAIANYDQFDFLIDIVPREDIKPPTGSHKKDSSAQSVSGATSSGSNNGGGNGIVTNATTGSMLNVGVGVKMEQGELLNFGTLTQEPLTASAVAAAQAQSAQAAPQTQHLQIIQQATTQPQQLQYFITIPGQQAGQPQLVQQLQLPQTISTNGLAPQLTGLNLVAQQPQQLILTPAPSNAAASQHQQQQHATLVQNLAAAQQQHHHQQQQQQIQLLQQVVTPSGEITNVPITINANQLNLLRLQMQQQPTHQPIQQQQQVIIPTQCLTAQQLLQLTTGNATTTTTTAAGGIAQQQLHQPQQQQHIVQQHHHHQQQQHNGNIFVNVSIPTQQQQQQQQQQNQQTQAGQTGTGNNGSNVTLSNDRQLGTYRSNC